MREFYNFMRHFQLINCRIMIHSFNELKCICKGESLAPSFTPDKIHEYMESIKRGEKLKPLPMGAYEYGCCVEYLKIIRRKLMSSRKNFKKLTLVFDEIDCYELVVCPLEDCLEMVAEEVGFKVINEEISGERYEYVLESSFCKG